MADKLRRPSQPRHENSIGKRIENLSFLPNIDTMLVEGVSPADVAKYVQIEMGEMEGVDPKTLENALRARKRQKDEIAQAFSGRMNQATEAEAEVEEEPKCVRPTVIVKQLYDRTSRGIKDLLELEAMFLTQRDRVDRLVTLEARSSVFSKDVGQEIIFAGQLIMMRTKVKHDLGIDEVSDAPELDMRRYSENTVNVLKRPESRRRVAALIERMARLNKLKVDLPPSEDEQIALPPPAATTKE